MRNKGSKKNLINLKILMLLIITATLLMLPTKSSANLQSRPGVTSLANKSASEFFLLARQMETSTGPMGLNATIEVQNDKVVETSSSNNIDVHMIKNTEYGTAAMLAASPYGKCPSGSSSTASITGNKSGIMQMAGGKYEYVAGIYNKSNSYNKYIYNADAKYKNVYESNVAADAYIPGDATYETHRWYGASAASVTSSSYVVFDRGNNGVFFCGSYDGNASSSDGSRVCVVCGVGL